jgi:hypothetical protein
MKAPHAYAAKKPVADYVRNNVVVTTSGNFSISALNQSIEEIGVERVLWSAGLSVRGHQRCGRVDRRGAAQRRGPAARSAAPMRKRCSAEKIAREKRP